MTTPAERGPAGIADGSAGQPTRNYLVTTSTATQQLDPVMNDTGTTTGYTGSPFTVAASSDPPTPAGTAGSGISITGCAACPARWPCRTARGPPSTRPGGPQPGGADLGPLTGLLLSATAITSPACLPLQTGTANAHNLGSASLTVTTGQAKLAGAGASQFGPSDSVDTDLVTAGQLVPATDMPVASGPC